LVQLRKNPKMVFWITSSSYDTRNTLLPVTGSKKCLKPRGASKKGGSSKKPACWTEQNVGFTTKEGRMWKLVLVGRQMTSAKEIIRTCSPREYIPRGCGKAERSRITLLLSEGVQEILNYIIQGHNHGTLKTMQLLWVEKCQ